MNGDDAARMEFDAHLMATIVPLKPHGIPFNQAACDSSTYNYSVARKHHEEWWLIEWRDGACGD